MSRFNMLAYQRRVFDMCLLVSCSNGYAIPFDNKIFLLEVCLILTQASARCSMRAFIPILDSRSHVLNLVGLHCAVPSTLA